MFNCDLDFMEEWVVEVGEHDVGPGTNHPVAMEWEEVLRLYFKVKTWRWTGNITTSAKIFYSSIAPGSEEFGFFDGSTSISEAEFVFADSDSDLACGAEITELQWAEDVYTDSRVLDEGTPYTQEFYFLVGSRFTLCMFSYEPTSNYPEPFAGRIFKYNGKFYPSIRVKLDSVVYFGGDPGYSVPLFHALITSTAQPEFAMDTYDFPIDDKLVVPIYKVYENPQILDDPDYPELKYSLNISSIGSLQPKEGEEGVWPWWQEGT